MKLNEIQDFLTNEERTMMDFIKQCLQIDPTKRMTCEEAIRHEWFKDQLIKSEKEIQERISEIQHEKE